jgi:transcriptional regulator with XRE-family HTH domain
MTDFSLQLRRLRTNAGLTQAQLAQKLSLSGQAISTWELGSREPSLDDLVKIADILDCSLDYLIGRDSKPPTICPDLPKWIKELSIDLKSLDSHGQEAVKALIKGLKK